jgi:hypothetical protein
MVPSTLVGCSAEKCGNYITFVISSCSVLTFCQQYTAMNKYPNFDTVLVRHLYENDKVQHRLFYDCIIAAVKNIDAPILTRV